MNFKAHISHTHKHTNKFERWENGGGGGEVENNELPMLFAMQRCSAVTSNSSMSACMCGFLFKIEACVMGMSKETDYRAASWTLKRFIPNSQSVRSRVEDRVLCGQAHPLFVALFTTPSVSFALHFTFST